MKSVNKKSIIGLSCTLNDDFTRYYSTTFLSQSKDLIFKAVPSEIMKAMEIYEKVNNGPPELLIFYRDGVGEG